MKTNTYLEVKSSLESLTRLCPRRRRYPRPRLLCPSVLAGALIRRREATCPHLLLFFIFQDGVLCVFLLFRVEALNNKIK